MALPRKLRLRKTFQFGVVRNGGTAKSGHFMTLAYVRAHAKPNPAGDGFLPPAPAQCGFTLTKKLGNAVVRNHTRRRLRSIVREIHPELTPGVWIITIPKKTAVDADFTALRNEWRKLAGKLRLLIGAQT